MRKKLLCIVSLIVLLCQSLSVCATDPKMVFNDINYYSAKIYVCDTKNDEAILLGVNPVSPTLSTISAREIEYRALPIAKERIVGTKGQKLTMDVVNGYLLDSPVRVLVGKNAYGYKILYMELLR